MTRISIVEPTRTVSFLVADNEVPRLVAACCSNPSSFAEFLAAAEAFQRGFTQRVADSLMAFDLALGRLGPDTVRDRLQRGEPIERHGAPAAFEATDEAMAALAISGDDVLVVDLSKKLLTVSAGLAVATSGAVQVHDGRAETGQSVTYELPGAWMVQSRA